MDAIPTIGALGSDTAFAPTAVVPKGATESGGGGLVLALARWASPRAAAGPEMVNAVGRSTRAIHARWPLASENRLIRFASLPGMLRHCPSRVDGNNTTDGDHELSPSVTSNPLCIGAFRFSPQIVDEQVDRAAGLDSRRSRI